MSLHKKVDTPLNNAEFSKLVKAYRKQRGWTQEQVAEKWGHTREYVSQVERGVRKLDKQEQVAKLAAILEIPSERLDAVGKGLPQRQFVAQTPSEADNVLFQTLLDSSLATVKLSWLVWYADRNADIIALAMTYQGDVLRKRGRYETAIRYLDMAKSYSDVAISSVAGMRWLILARAHSAYGVESQFLDAIDHAQEIVMHTKEDLDTLSNQFSLVEVLQERAQGYTMLWKPQMALDIYKETDILRPFRPLRDLGSYIIVKAQAHAYNGDVEQGIVYAIDGLELATQYHSARHVSRVQLMYDRLNVTPIGKHPRMKDLQEALHKASKNVSLLFMGSYGN